MDETSDAPAMVLAGYAAAIMRTRAFPLWMAWFAIIVAVVSVLGAFTVVNTGGALAPGGALVAIPGVLTAVWVPAASWPLFREHLPIPTAGARPVRGH